MRSKSARRGGERRWRWGGSAFDARQEAHGPGAHLVLVPPQQVRARRDDLDELAHLPAARLHDGLNLLRRLEQQRASLVAPGQLAAARARVFLQHLHLPKLHEPAALSLPS
jgi:hypothetical protein